MLNHQTALCEFFTVQAAWHHLAALPRCKICTVRMSTILKMPNGCPCMHMQRAAGTAATGLGGVAGQVPGNLEVRHCMRCLASVSQVSYLFPSIWILHHAFCDIEVPGAYLLKGFLAALPQLTPGIIDLRSQPCAFPVTARRIAFSTKCLSLSSGMPCRTASLRPVNGLEPRAVLLFKRQPAWEVRWEQPLAASMAHC